MGADRVDRIVELIDEGLVSAEGQTCGEGVTYDAEPIPSQPGGQVCDDPECWCRDGSLPACDTCEPDCRACLTGRHSRLGAFRSDGFTVRRVMEDGTLGEPIEGIISVEAAAPVFPARAAVSPGPVGTPVSPDFAAWAARATPEELADLADCSRDRNLSFQEWHDSLPWNRDE